MNRLVDIATESNWSFLEDAKFMSALDNCIRKVASAQGLSEEELRQETYLHIAVRPEWAARQRKNPMWKVKAVARELREHPNAPEFVGLEAAEGVPVGIYGV